MARGAKYSDEIKEKAFARFYAGDAVAEIAKDLKVPRSTVSGWVKKSPQDNLSDLREKHRKEFIERANRIIDKGMRLLEERFEKALSKEEEINLIIDEIARSGEDVISDKAKVDIIRKLRELLVYDPKAIAVAIGTVYDKRDRSEARAEEKDAGGVVFIPQKKEE